MNCTNHPEVPAAAFCRECGKAMCQACQQPALGSIYCQDHVPAAARFAAEPPPLPPDYAFNPSPATERPRPAQSFADSPYSAPIAPAPVTADRNAHPVLALILGFIPGVGAIYNGQYAKGLIHAVVFGLLVSLLNNVHSDGSQAFLGIMLAVWVMYQAFEAYHTARKRRYGVAVDEFSSLFDIKPASGKFPVGAVLLIGIGFILLLDTTEIIRFDRVARYWPVGLIALGVYLLYSRLHPSSTSDIHAANPANEGTRQ